MTARQTLAAITAVLMLLVTDRAWPQRGDSRGAVGAANATGILMASTADASAPATVRWQKNSPDPGPYGWYSGVVSNGKRVFTYGSLGDTPATEFWIRAHRSRDGKSAWDDRVRLSTAERGGGHWVQAAASGQRLFVAGSSVTTSWGAWGVGLVVRAYQGRTGKLLWQAEHTGTYRTLHSLSWPLVAGVVAHDKMVIVASTVQVPGKFANLDIEVVAHSTATGDLLWKARHGSTKDGEMAVALATDGDGVYVGGPAGKRANHASALTGWHLIAQNASSGTVRWQERERRPAGPEALATGAGRLWAAGGNVLRAYRAEDGRVLWQSKLPSKSSPRLATDSRSVFVAQNVWPGGGGPAGVEVRSYDGESGELLWSTRVPSFVVVSFQHVGTHLALAASWDDQLYVATIDPSSGEMVVAEEPHGALELTRTRRPHLAPWRRGFVLSTSYVEDGRTAYLLRAYKIPNR